MLRTWRPGRLQPRRQHSLTALLTDCPDRSGAGCRAQRAARTWLRAGLGGLHGPRDLARGAVAVHVVVSGVAHERAACKEEPVVYVCMCACARAGCGTPPHVDAQHVCTQPLGCPRAPWLLTSSVSSAPGVKPHLFLRQPLSLRPPVSSMPRCSASHAKGLLGDSGRSASSPPCPAASSPCSSGCGSGACAPKCRPARKGEGEGAGTGVPRRKGSKAGPRARTRHAAPPAACNQARPPAPAYPLRAEAAGRAHRAASRAQTG